VRRASARAALPLTPPEALALWADVERWPSFVEGFARHVELTPNWPEPGGRIVWESTPDGRGRVTETVTQSAPDRFTTQIFEQALTGTQTLRVLPANDGSEDDGSEAELSLEYELTRYGPLGGVADALFIRRALRDALRRTLFRFGVEAEEEASLR
jgi:polyketide cyclase/dehydrase/lipid transport protein